MQVSAIIGMAQRACGILGQGQTALPQDLTDAQNFLTQLMMQWRQKRWLVFRLDSVDWPITSGQGTYTIGPANPPAVTNPVTPDVIVNGNYRPANIQSAYLRLNTGVGGTTGNYPLDFPVQILESREQYDAIRLKALQSWPSAIYYDPQIPNGVLNIWPVPIQQNFSFHLGFQQAIDLAAEGSQSLDLDTILPTESQLAIVWNLGLQLAVAYKLPPDPQLQAAARASLHTLRMVNFALRPLEMPVELWGGEGRMKNPMGGFIPEVAAGVPFGVLS